MSCVVPSKLLYALLLSVTVKATHTRVFEDTGNKGLAFALGFNSQEFVCLPPISVAQQENFEINSRRNNIMRQIRQSFENLDALMDSIRITGSNIITQIDNLNLTPYQKDLVLTVAKYMIDSDFYFPEDVKKIISLLGFDKMYDRKEQQPCLFMSNPNKEGVENFMHAQKKEAPGFRAPLGYDFQYETKELFKAEDAWAINQYYRLCLIAHTFKQSTEELLEYYFSSESNTGIKLRLWESVNYSDERQLYNLQNQQNSKQALAKIASQLNAAKALEYLAALKALMIQQINSYEDYANRINVAISLMNHLSNPRFMTLVHRSAFYILSVIYILKAPLLIPNIFLYLLIYVFSFEIYLYQIGDDYFRIRLEKSPFVKASEKFFRDVYKFTFLAPLASIVPMITFFMFYGYGLLNTFESWRTLFLLKAIFFICCEIFTPTAMSFNLTIMDAWKAEQEKDFGCPVIYLFSELMALKVISVLIILLQNYIPFYFILISSVFIMLTTPSSQIEIKDTMDFIV